MENAAESDDKDIATLRKKAEKTGKPIAYGRLAEAVEGSAEERIRQSTWNGIELPTAEQGGMLPTAEEMEMRREAANKVLGGSG